MSRGKPVVQLELVSDREAYVPMLLEADESEKVLRTYLHGGLLFRIVADGNEVGAVLVIDEGGRMEIKNIVLTEANRGRGLGRASVEAVAAFARRTGAEGITVGTADSSIGTIEFYRRVGFREAGRIEGFFDAYPEPVIEDGVTAHDMIRFEMEL